MITVFLCDNILFVVERTLAREEGLEAITGVYTTERVTVMRIAAQLTGLEFHEKARAGQQYPTKYGINMKVPKGYAYIEYKAFTSEVVCAFWKKVNDLTPRPAPAGSSKRP